MEVSLGKNVLTLRGERDDRGDADFLQKMAALFPQTSCVLRLQAGRNSDRLTINPTIKIGWQISGNRLQIYFGIIDNIDEEALDSPGRAEVFLEIIDRGEVDQDFGADVGAVRVHFLGQLLEKIFNYIRLSQHPYKNGEMIFYQYAPPPS